MRHIQSIKGHIYRELGLRAYKTRPLVSTPFTPIQINMAPEPSLEQGTRNKNLYNSTTTLRLATATWWKILVPDEAAIRALCQTLAVNRIHVCFLCGLPTLKAAEHLDGKFGYAYHGHWRSDINTAGFLVGCEWEGLVSDTHVSALPGVVCSSRGKAARRELTAESRSYAIVLDSVPLV